MSPPSVRLGEVVDVLPGFAFKSEFFNDSDGLPVVRIRDIVRGNTDTYYTGPYTEQFVVNDGDILIGMDGNFNAARWGGGRALLNQRVCKVIAKASILDEAYLFYYLPIVLKRIEDATPFVTVKHLSADNLREDRIPLPALPEQRRIAAILDKADALRTKRREALAQLDRLAQSIFVEMFGDPVLNPKGWPQVALGELLASGPQNGLYKPSSDYGSGTLILRIDAFYDGVVTGLSALRRVRVAANEVALYGLHEGEIVINRVNSPAYLGKSALIPALPEPVIFESNMMRLALNAELALPSYVISFLQTDYIKAQVRTASKDAVNQSSINQQDVKSFRINLPPLSLQNSFSQRLTEVERLRLRILGASKESNDLFLALRHSAFRGEL